MVIGSYISILTLNVNRLNAPIKRHWLAGQMKTCACIHSTYHFIFLTPWIVCNCFILLGNHVPIMVCMNVEPTFSLSSSSFLKRLFSSPSLSAVRVVSYVFLRLLIFLPAILISACASSSPAFHMMYSSYKLNKQGDNIQPWRTPFPIWNQFVVTCLVLTVASWPAYRFLKRQVRWSGIPISFRIFHSLLWFTQSKALA